jgi:hypothetical protein
MSTAYHPETDGQTERVNQTIEVMLRFYVNYHTNNWDQFLDIVEYSYNNQTNASTSMSPFYANFGYTLLHYGQALQITLKLSTDRSMTPLSKPRSTILLLLTRRENIKNSRKVT